jgi:hypothetical protein
MILQRVTPALRPMATRTAVRSFAAAAPAVAESTPAALSQPAHSAQPRTHIRLWEEQYRLRDNFMLWHKYNQPFAYYVHRRAQWGFYWNCATVYAASFVAIQGLEYQALMFGWYDSTYGTMFYSITGTHGLHVTVGAIMLTIQRVRLALNHQVRNDAVAFQVSLWYWHFVDVIWLLVFTFIYGLGSAYDLKYIRDIRLRTPVETGGHVYRV